MTPLCHLETLARTLGPLPQARRRLRLEVENKLFDRPVCGLYVRILAANPDGLGPVWVRQGGGGWMRNPKTITRL